jgi:hypothetical protein
MKDTGQPRASAEYEWDQRQPIFRKKLKQLIESGVPRNLARGAARAAVSKPKMKRTDGDSDE